MEKLVTPPVREDVKKFFRLTRKPRIPLTNFADTDEKVLAFSGLLSTRSIFFIHPLFIISLFVFYSFFITLNVLFGTYLMKRDPRLRISINNKKPGVYFFRDSKTNECS